MEYSDINAAARALTTLNGTELRGRAIYVREDRVGGGGGGGGGHPQRMPMHPGAPGQGQGQGQGGAFYPPHQQPQPGGAPLGYGHMGQLWHPPQQLGVGQQPGQQLWQPPGAPQGPGPQHGQGQGQGQGQQWYPDQQQWHAAQQQQQQQGGGGQGYGHPQQGYGHPPRQAQEQREGDTGQTKYGQDVLAHLESPRLYVNNLAWNVTWQDLKGLFRRVCWVKGMNVHMSASDVTCIHDQFNFTSKLVMFDAFCVCLIGGNRNEIACYYTTRWQVSEWRRDCFTI